MSGFQEAAAAEWLKLRSVRSTWWFLAGAVALMLLVAPGTALTVGNNLEGTDEPLHSVAVAPLAGTGVLYGVNIVFGALALLAVTAEFASRSMSVSLACVPSRGRLLGAKAVVAGAAVFAAGVPVAALGLVTSVGPLGDYAAPVAAGAATGQVLAMGYYLAMVAVLAVGLGAVVRSTAGALAVLFVLLWVLPMALESLAELVGSWVGVLAELTPTMAAERFIGGEWAYG
ncbi:ABC transporter permease, partial [Streptomyces sp. A7024]